MLDGPVRALLEGKNFGFLGTTRPDGRAHVVPVWLNTDGERLFLNSAEGRHWVANVDRDPRLTLTVPNMGDPYEYVQIRGRVVGRTHEGADEHIDALARKYLGTETYPWRVPGQQRVSFTVEPERVIYHGG